MQTNHRHNFVSAVMGAVAAAVLVLPASAKAGDTTLTGKVEATPAKFLGETVVYVKQATAPPSAKKWNIDQKGMKFVPHVTALTVGDTVEFMNHDAVEHNVFTPDNEGYNLGMIKPNAGGQYKFAKPGVYTQLCSVHPEMLAFVFVGQNPYHAVVDDKGNYKIEHLPAGTYQLAVWNSHLKAAEQPVTTSEGKPTEANFSLKR